MGINWQMEKMLAEYCLNPELMVPENDVSLLVDDSAFVAMLDAIGLASKYIFMESYIFNNDRAGQIFSDALCFASRKGVDVFLAVDGLGTINVSSDFFERMRREGVHVLIYHPVVPWRKGFNFFRRNHRKLLVVDGVKGFAGGLNIGSEWFDKKRGGKGWHDIHAVVSGAAVFELEEIARKLWIYHAGAAPVLPEHGTGVPENTGTVFVRVAASSERKKKRLIRRSYMHAIKNAKQYIYIANAYFVPDFSVRYALKKAVAAGVDVRVMVPAHGDIFPVHMAGAAIYAGLLRKGVRIFEWKETVLHAKTAVIDDIWSTVGSYNLDRRSMTMNLEVTLNVIDRKFAGSLRDVFAGDESHCREIDLAVWNRRSWFLKITERFFYLFRNFM